jgi:uncharacterized membrane protein YdbT with pleckstrin-like domain
MTLHAYPPHPAGRDARRAARRARLNRAAGGPGAFVMALILVLSLMVSPWTLLMIPVVIAWELLANRQREKKPLQRE